MTDRKLKQKQYDIRKLAILTIEICQMKLEA